MWKHTELKTVFSIIFNSVLQANSADKLREELIKCREKHFSFAVQLSCRKAILDISTKEIVINLFTLIFC